MKLRPQVTPLKFRIRSRRSFYQMGAVIKFSVSVVFVSFLALGLCSIVSAQQGMSVIEKDESGKAKLIDLDFVGAELQALLKFISTETDLTIIASEQDIKDKKFSLTNLKNVTIEEALEHIKTVLSQYNLTMIRTDRTILITTLEKAVKMKVPTIIVESDPEQIEETDEVRTYIIRMKNAVVTDQLTKNFKNMVSKSAVMFADTTSNSIIMTDIASNIRRIAKILQIIDEPSAEAGLKIRIFPLANANAQSLERTLDDFFEDVEGMGREVSRRGPEEMQKMLEFAKTKGIDIIRGRVVFSAESDSNSLIVKASEQNIKLIETLIEQLDTPPDVKIETKIYKLDYAIAEDVADVLEEIILGFSAGQRPGRRADWWQKRDWERRRERMKERGGNVESIVGEVNVVADERLNAVIVGSDPRNFPLIEKLINELDTADPQEEIKIFFIKNADATTMVQNLQDLFEGGSQRNQDMPWWMRDRRRDQQGDEAGFGVQGQVNLIADDRLNAILASTASQNLPIIEDLINKLDVIKPEQEWGTKIYKLEYADAENVANIINDVYQGSGGGRDFFRFLPRRSRTQSQGSLAGNVQAQEYLTMNAVIISTSTARNFKLIEEFIEKIDTPTPKDQKEITRSIRLEYADAQEMEQILNNIWEGESTGRFGFMRFMMRGGTPEQKDVESLRGKVQVYADTQTNSLIVTTRQRYIETAEELIKQLDFVRGMVWLDISILEITLDENTKLGLELSAKEKGIFGLENWTGEFQSTLGLEDAISGFDYSMATKDYLGMLHTLMEQNKAKTLSTPSCITRDNQQVSFTRGKQVPYLQSATESEYGGPGQRIYDYGFLDVGITIDITPHIAKSQSTDGEKRTIGLEIEQINVSNFIEFTEFNAPITEDSTISAYIDVKDGESVVIGGMIRSRRQEIEDKVPILGDIPLIGRLFKKTEDAVEDSELVIIITPRIVDIKNPEDVKRLKTHSDEVFPNTDKEIERHFGDSEMRKKHVPSAGEVTEDPKVEKP